MIGIVPEIVGGSALLASFVRLGDLYEDLSPILEPVGEEFLSDQRKKFEAGGPGWEPLAESTIRRKGHSRILRDEDDLYGSFEKDAPGNVFRISKTEAEFGTSDPKAKFHQEGGGWLPQRVIIDKPTSEDEARFTRIASDKQMERINALGFEAL